LEMGCQRRRASDAYGADCSWRLHCARLSALVRLLRLRISFQVMVMLTILDDTYSEEDYPHVP